MTNQKKVAGRVVVDSGVLLSPEGADFEIYPFGAEDYKCVFVFNMDENLKEGVVNYRSIDNGALIEANRGWDGGSPLSITKPKAFASDVDFKYYMYFSMEFFGQPDRHGVRLTYTLVSEPTNGEP